MSQHDFNIANQGFPATRADINNAFQAIASNSSGPTAPSTTYANMWWYDTTNNKMYLRNEADSAWIEVATIDQTNNEWQITTGVVQAKDGDGLALKTDDGTTRIEIQDDGDVAFDTDTLFVDAVNDRVGINTSSPDTQLVIANGSDTLKSNLDGDSIDIFASGKTFNLGTTSNTVMRLFTNNAEGARLDESGNFFVSATTTSGFQSSTSVQGTILYEAGGVASNANNDTAGVFNRQTGDGVVVLVKKDGVTAGSLDTKFSSGGNRLVVGNSNTKLQFNNGADQIIPSNNDGNSRDNAIDMGASGARFDDIYATNGTIQTSDQNDKQQIASLTDAEITAAKEISKLFKTFKWNDSVAEKGDAARTHTGVIAQEVEQAMTDAGLNAGDYAFFISSTWWETQTEVPAVEAVEAVEATYDEEGNVLTGAVEAVEAQEAYTSTETFLTIEEAPEGATERTRKGIRYPQLLSFIGAATEQRLASIESRLDALESA